MNRPAARLLIVLVLFSAGLGATRIAAGAAAGQPCTPGAVKQGSTCNTATSTSAATTTTATTTAATTTTATVSTATSSTSSSTSTKTSGSHGGPPKTASVQTFSLQSEYIQNTPNTSAPTWCLNEDDFHQRNWSGSLNGSFVATEQLCDPTVDFSAGLWWDAGGIGLQADLYVTGTLSQLSITSPQGVTQSAVLVGSSSYHTVVTNHYQVCFVPQYSVSTGIGGTPLAGGTWTFALAGSFSNATYTINGLMASPNFQQQSCPTADQNLLP